MRLYARKTKKLQLRVYLLPFFCLGSVPKFILLMYPVAIKLGMVEIMIQMKKFWYPINSSILPDIIPGSIMPKAIKPVQIA